MMLLAVVHQFVVVVLSLMGDSKLFPPSRERDQ
jgi:hypothetical protein